MSTSDNARNPDSCENSAVDCAPANARRRELVVGTTRFTRQRAELLAVLDEVGTFQTPLQVYRELRTRGVICRPAPPRSRSARS